jgi:hypothetical protein
MERNYVWPGPSQPSKCRCGVNWRPLPLKAQQTGGQEKSRGQAMTPHLKKQKTATHVKRLLIVYLGPAF